MSAELPVPSLPAVPLRRLALRQWGLRLRRWRPSLRGQLLLLALLVVAPLVALELRQATDDMRQARGQAQTQVQEQADRLAAQASATLDRARLMLEFLAQRPETAGLDSRACGQLLESMASLDPHWANLGMVAVDGVALCSSVSPAGIGQLNFRNRPWLLRGLAAAGFATHDLRMGRMVGRPVIMTTHPHRDRQGRVDALLVLSLDANRLTEDWMPAALPPGSVVELSGQAGLLLSRRVGTVDPEAEHFGAVAKVAGSDWLVSVRQPVAPLVARHGAKLREELLQLLACGLMAMVLALVLSRRISEPLRALTDAARASARGDRGVRVQAPRGELRYLAEQFNRMQEVRERGEDALRHNLQLFELAATSGNVWCWDIEGGSGILLGTARSLLGFPLQNAGLSIAGWHELIHEEDRPQLREALIGHLRWHRPYHLELRARHADGSERMLQLRGQAVWNGDGRAVRMAGTVFDVTERHQVQQAQRQQALAEAASAAKSGFVARMGHELRTPLNAVLGFAQLMEADAAEPLTPGQSRRLQHIAEAGQHLLALMDDMMDTARIELGQLRVSPEAVTLGPLVQAVQDLQQEEAVRQGVRLQPLSVGREGLQVRADPLRLRQVLLNLISNAIKYNRPGGKVRLSAWAEGAQVCLSVEDEGPGFSEAQLAQLFQPYNRLGRERSGIPGVGLGLALTRQLLELMQGSLEIGNAPGRGCRALVRLQAV
ncbi:ATP-binding protein [Pelomonas sp. SE-A7]|uniref:sensor histidine kinase n=1 Tax=Pelomonas sp. SE-A7 TaxID=3054953 RepID=UPI00259C9725|nr:ATP-binding protein [Pelomonas sp. SE-A7]MDM4765061.1 ATP-binding protein [Pelomonas sp. SE-A7]